jgi:anti-anti-sigma factor
MGAPAELGAGVCCCPVVEVQVRGDLDLTAVPRMRERLNDALSLQPHVLVVDLSACTSFGAQGITMLLEVHRRAWRQQAMLTLRGCSDRHLQMLALMGLQDVFDIDRAPYAKVQG